MGGAIYGIWQMDFLLNFQLSVGTDIKWKSKKF